MLRACVRALAELVKNGVEILLPCLVSREGSRLRTVFVLEVEQEGLCHAVVLWPIGGVSVRSKLRGDKVSCRWRNQGIEQKPLNQSELQPLKLIYPR